ncbi:hypothetical protein [Neoaquamicrobium sediminum]
MNHNFTKLSMLLHPSVTALVTNLPASAGENECFIETSTGRIGMWSNGEWWTVDPKIGVLAYVAGLDQYWQFSPDEEWVLAFDLNADFAPIERNLSFYAPGLVRPNAPLFAYVPTMEFTLPAGAPGSHAVLDVAPAGGNLILTFAGGTITFLDGQTEGTFSVASDYVIHPAETEGMYAQPTVLTITSGSTFNAQGLSVSLRGKIRAID